ncbi:MAG: response regulator [Planctomycetaceae bacterium]
MVSILVVDDSAVDRRLAGGLLAKQDGWVVHYASGGKDAASWLRDHTVDVIVTDLQMPEMNGLEFVRHVRAEHPLTPVILMTGQGSEDIAVQALESGAASYVPKRLMETDLIETIERVLTLAGEKRVRRSLISRMRSLQTHFVLENDPAMLSSMVAYFQGLIVDMGIFSESERLKIGVALEEALLNASYHGNLEVSSRLRELDYSTYYNLARERRATEPYKSRRIYVDVDLSCNGVVYVIRDEGPGFDPHSQPDPRAPENIERPSGRGLLLMRSFMDRVEYNASGNMVRLEKKTTVCPTLPHVE